MSRSVAETKGNSRFEVLDIMKGILIVLVVLGHTNTPLTRWIYSFHMAAFFAISGYLWNDRHAGSSKDALSFIISRLKRLYLPFVAVNITYILLNNMFVKIGFYTTDPSFLELTKDWPVQQSVGSVFGINRIVTASIKSLCLMSGSASLVNTCWFLSTLFLISLFHLGVCLVTRKADVKLKTIIYSLFFAVSLILAELTTTAAVMFKGGGTAYIPGVCSLPSRCNS